MRQKRCEEWCEEAVEDGLGFCKGVGEDKQAASRPQTSRWHRAHRKVEVEAAAAGKKESVSMLFFHGGAFLGGGGFFHRGHALVDGRRVDGQMEKSAAEGVEEGDL